MRKKMIGVIVIICCIVLLVKACSCNTKTIEDEEKEPVVKEQNIDNQDIITSSDIDINKVSVEETEEVVEIKETEKVTEAVKETEPAIKEVDKKMYATVALNIRSGANSDSAKKGAYGKGSEVVVTGELENGWVQVEYDGEEGYVSGKYLSDEKPVVEVQKPKATEAKKKSNSSNTKSEDKKKSDNNKSQNSKKASDNKKETKKSSDTKKVAEKPTEKKDKPNNNTSPEYSFEVKSDGEGRIDFGE